MKDEYACTELLNAIKYVLKREDLVQNMENRYNAFRNRGKALQLYLYR